MAGKAPGRHHRKGISLVKVTAMIPDDAAAEKWIAEQRWPDGPFCPHCGSVNVQEGVKHPTMTHRCRDCPNRPFFSLKTGTVMEGTKLGYRVWAIAVYLLATNLKSVSSMKLHRDLEICQKSAWYLAHRLRESWKVDGGDMFAGPVEIDETHLGGKRKNMPKAKRKLLKGRGAVGKTVVAGAKDRATNQVVARSVPAANSETLQGFVREHVAPEAKVYTDDHGAYKGMPFEHEAVNHSVGEYVRGMASTNGIESFWSMLKRGYQGTFHHFSEKHTDRYVTEFAGRHNDRKHRSVQKDQRTTTDDRNSCVTFMAKG